MVKANSLILCRFSREIRRHVAKKKKKKDYFHNHESLSVPDTVTEQHNS